MESKTKFINLGQIVGTMKDALFIIGPLFTLIIFIAGLIIRDTDTYKEFRLVVDYGYYAKEVLIPRANSTHKWQDNKIKELEILIGQRYPEEQHSFSVGLRYDINKKRIFFRDEHKELRPILYEAETGFYYYRDMNDRKRYVNY